MAYIFYKDESKQQNLQSNLLNDDRPTSSQGQFDLTFHSIIDDCNNLIFAALESFHEKEIDKYFEIIKEMLSFLDNLYHEDRFNIDSIFPEVFNPDFNACLIDSINPTLYEISKINEVLAIISTISSFTDNFQFFRNYSIFDIVFNLLQLQNPEVYLECILLINQYMVVFQTTEFPYDQKEFIFMLDEISNYPNIIKYISETLYLLIIYVDVHKYLDNILYLLNRMFPNIQSIRGLNDIINCCIYIVNQDPSNYILILHSKIIDTFTDLFANKFIKNLDKYQIVIQHFFDFLKIAFGKIDFKLQEQTIKYIFNTFPIIFNSIEDEKMNLTIYLIMFKYLQSHCGIDDEIYFFADMLNSGFITYLLNTFNDQTFDMKRYILLIINQLLKTQNQELFSQLIEYDPDANYIEVCSDFVMSAEDDSKVQIAFLESLINLVQIGEKENKQNLITESPAIDEYVDSCLTSEDQNVQVLAYQFFNLTTKEEEQEQE